MHMYRIMDSLNVVIHIFVCIFIYFYGIRQIHKNNVNSMC